MGLDSLNTSEHASACILSIQDIIDRAIIDLVLIVSIKILHGPPVSKRFRPHSCEGHETKCSCCFDLPRNLPLSLGTDASLHKRQEAETAGEASASQTRSSKLRVTCNSYRIKIITLLLLIMMPASVMKFARNLTFCRERESERERGRERTDLKSLIISIRTTQ